MSTIFDEPVPQSPFEKLVDNTLVPVVISHLSDYAPKILKTQRWNCAVLFQNAVMKKTKEWFDASPVAKLHKVSLKVNLRGMVQDYIERGLCGITFLSEKEGVQRTLNLRTYVDRKDLDIYTGCGL